MSTETSFDLFRVTRSKRAVDLSPNTIRKFHRQGLPLYKRDGGVYVSRAELANFIKQPAKAA